MSARRPGTGGWEEAFEPLLEPNTPMEEFGAECTRLHREIVLQEEEEHRLAVEEALRVRLLETTGRAPLSDVTTAAVQRLLLSTANPQQRMLHATHRK